jgi:glycosyltransferase involved in cell wall biosynthesis
MKLLILTQKVSKSDDVLGFMHGWISEFAKNCESVVAVCLEEGTHNLPPNVRVLSLGKEKGRSRIKYLFNFYKYIWRERGNYDAVFVHMNPEYVVLGGPFWRLWGKKVTLWYAHGFVTRSLRLAEKLVNIIFTSTVSGCRLVGDKIKVIGQGIDTEKFRAKEEKDQSDGEIFKIVTIGRISPSKDYETLIRSADLMRNQGMNFKVDIVGGLGLTDQGSYFDLLKKLVSEKKLESIISFVGPVSNDNILPYLHNSDLFVNMGQTGSLDKAIVEAMSAGLPILTCNEALKEVLGKYTDELMFPKKDHVQLSAKIRSIIGLGAEQRFKLGLALRDIVVREHSLPLFIKKIVNIINR